MSDQGFKKLLESAFPDTPDVVIERMQTVSQQALQHKKAKRKKLMSRALLAALIALTLTGAAASVLNHYGVFGFGLGMMYGSEEYYYTLPEVQDMVHYELCTTQVGTMEWSVREAIYDGRVLRVVYAVRDTTETKPFTQQQMNSENMQGIASDYYYAMCQREGMYLAADGNGAIAINGLEVNLESVLYRLGEQPGEVLFWIDCRMEYYDQEAQQYTSIQPEGVIDLFLAFRYTKERTDNPPDGMHFIMNVKDAASRYAVEPPAPYTLKIGGVVRFTDLHFSPATVYITYSITVPKAQVSDWDEDALWDIHSEYWSREGNLMDANGKPLGVNTTGWGGLNIDEYGDLCLRYHTEYTPSDAYTDTIYLIMGDEKVPIPMGYANP